MNEHSGLPWRVGTGHTVLSDDPAYSISGGNSPSDAEYYGGYLVAESVSLENAQWIVKIANATMKGKSG